MFFNVLLKRLLVQKLLALNIKKKVAMTCM